MSRDGDPLMAALKLLAAEGGNASFSAIRWCPKEHVLSFQRMGMSDEWLNLYLHGSGDEPSHLLVRNGSSGGTDDVLLWEDGRWPADGGPFVFTVPARIDPHSFDGDAMYAGRVEHRDFEAERP